MNTAEIKRRAALWIAEGRPAVLVALLAVKGSAPRAAGTRMLVAADATLGTIGGGHLEWMAQATARKLLQGAQAWPAPQRVALGPALGQCCGGSVELAYEPLSDASLQAWALPLPRFHLCLYGAGHVGTALVRALRDIDLLVDWIDSREDAFSAECANFMQDPDQLPFAAGAADASQPSSLTAAGTTASQQSSTQATGLRCWVSDDPARDAAAAPPGAHHVVMTHHHGLDFDIVCRVLQRQDTGWVGLIGSRSKRQQFVHRLLARGLTPERIAALNCPVGLDGIAGREPAVVAVAVAAQLLSLPCAAG